MPGAEQRRENDKSILTLTMAVGRLADSQSSMADAQSGMSNDIKDLSKTISKLDVVMEKLVNIEERYSRALDGADIKIKALEKNQAEGCPALIAHKTIYMEYKKFIVWFVGVTVLVAGILIGMAYNADKRIELIENEMKHCNKSINENKEQIGYVKGRLRQ